MWQFQIESFAQKFHVVSYSRRYAYPNQWPGDGEDNSLTNNATDLAELIIKRLDLGPAHLIGHSYGALTALYMAYQHPELVRTLPSYARAVLMDNVKSLRGELASISQRFTLEDAQKVTMPTLLVKGERSPKFLHQIIGILANCMPNSEELIIPAESHNLGLEKPQVFNSGVLEFLSIRS